MNQLKRLLNYIQHLRSRFSSHLIKIQHTSDEAKEILNKSTVIRLDENGNELFGRSWNIKD